MSQNCAAGPTVVMTVRTSIQTSNLAHLRRRARICQGCEVPTSLRSSKLGQRVVVYYVAVAHYVVAITVLGGVGPPPGRRH